MVTSTGVCPCITISSAASRNVTASAIRLFTHGYLSKLRYNGTEDGHLYFTVPSESRSGVIYTLDYEPATARLHCSCPAGNHGLPCKHVRLLQFRNGWVQEAE